MSKFAWQNGPVRPYLAACPGSSTWVNSLIRLFFTAKTASDSIYGLPATKICVVSARCPGAVTMKWMCAGRYGCRSVAISSLPTGPSVGIG